MAKRRVAVSVDIRNTLFSTSRFFDVLSSAFSAVMGISSSEALECLKRAYKRVKRMRARGEIDLERVVEQCIEVLAGELGAPREDVKRGVAKALASGDLDGLVFEDALVALEELESAGIPVVAVSNVTFWPSWYTRLVLERVGLGELLAVQVYADEVRAMKPDP